MFVVLIAYYKFFLNLIHISQRIDFANSNNYKRKDSYFQKKTRERPGEIRHLNHIQSIQGNQMQPNYPTGNYQNFLIKTNRLGNSIKAIYQNNYVFTFNTVFYYVNQVDYPNILLKRDFSIIQ